MNHLRVIRKEMTKEELIEDMLERVKVIKKQVALINKQVEDQTKSLSSMRVFTIVIADLEREVNLLKNK